MKFKNYLNKFLHNQEGAELIEWGIIIIIVAALIGIGFGIGDMMEGKMTEVSSTLETNLSRSGSGENATPPTNAG